MFARLERTGKIPEKFVDIRNRQEILELIQVIKPSVIVHMAAQPLVLESYKSPVETFDINVMGTAHVLDAAFSTNSVQVIGVVTTDKVYLNDNSGLPFSENSPLGGKDPYSASKAATEQVVNAWRSIMSSTGGPSVISMRAGNVIGGGDFARDRLLPDLIRGILNNETVTVRNSHSTRPWQHVLDPLYGYILFIEAVLNSDKCKTMNFGPVSKSMSVMQVVEIVKKANNQLKVEFKDQQATQYESVLLQLSSDRAKDKLGWESRITQIEAIKSTVAWWQVVSNAQKLNEITEKTVLDYLKKVALD